jgi:hypothetical protein
MGDVQKRHTAEEIIGMLREVEIRVARGQSQTQTQTQTEADPGIQIEDVVPLLFNQPIATTRLDGLRANHSDTSQGPFWGESTHIHRWSD